jgi:hypothetical protein
MTDKPQIDWSLLGGVSDAFEAGARYKTSKDRTRLQIQKVSIDFENDKQGNPVMELKLDGIDADTGELFGYKKRAKTDDKRAIEMIGQQVVGAGLPKTIKKLYETPAERLPIVAVVVEKKQGARQADGTEIEAREFLNLAKEPNQERFVGMVDADEPPLETIGGEHENPFV